MLTAILVPVGMGYAEASGLPAIYGLYATIVPLVAYAIFGPSRILVLGPDSSLAAIIAATILPLAAGDPDRLVALAGMLAIFTGALCILAGLASFGFITDLLSKPIRLGYLNGIALTVLIGQLPKILGFSSSGDNLIQEAISLVHGIAQGLTNWTSVADRRCVPGHRPDLQASLAQDPRCADRRRRRDDCRGCVQSGSGRRPLGGGAAAAGPAIVPVPARVTRRSGTLFAGALAIALVAFADTSVLSRTFALARRLYGRPQPGTHRARRGERGRGAVSGFLHQQQRVAHPGGGIGGRQDATDRRGWRALYRAVADVCADAAAEPAQRRPGRRRDLGLYLAGGCQGVVRLYHLRRGEFWLSIVCFLGVALIGVIQGIFIAIALALLGFIWRAWRPYDAVLGRVDGLKGYHDITRHPEAKRIPGLVLFRWDAPLFFANAEVFHEHVLQAIADAPTPTKWVVVAAEPVTDIDITAAEALSALDDDLQRWHRAVFCRDERPGEGSPQAL